MYDRRLGLIVDPLAKLTHTEGEIGILIVGWRICGVEASERLPVLAPDRKAGARTVVGRTQIAVRGEIRIVVPPPVPRRAVAPDNAPGLLQPSVRIDQSRTDQASIGTPVENVQ